MLCFNIDLAHTERMTTPRNLALTPGASAPADARLEFWFRADTRPSLTASKLSGFPPPPKLPSWRFQFENPASNGRPSASVSRPGCGEGPRAGTARSGGNCPRRHLPPRGGLPVNELKVWPLRRVVVVKSGIPASPGRVELQR